MFNVRILSHNEVSAFDSDRDIR